MNLQNGLPAAVETERSLLGAILMAPELFHQTSSLIVTDFHDGANKMIFSAMLELSEENRPLDAALVYEIVKRHLPTFSISSLSALTYGMVQMSSVKDYVAEIKTAAAKRAALRDLERLQREILSGTLATNQISERLSDIDSGLRNTYAEQTDSFVALGDILLNQAAVTLEGYHKNEAGQFLLSTGFASMDEILGGGLYYSGVFALIAPPKSGKSATALQLAERISTKNDVTVGVFSREMSNLQNAFRLISQRSVQLEDEAIDMVPRNFIKPGISEFHYEKSMKALASLTGTKLLFCQQPLSFEEMAAEVERMVKEKGLKVLVVDYWQLVFTRSKGKSRTEMLGDIAQGLKDLAQKHNIAVVVLAQFNNEGLKKRKSDEELDALHIEGSGALLKAANIVAILDMEDADPENPYRARPGSMNFVALRDAAPARLPIEFHGQFLTLRFI